MSIELWQEAELMDMENSIVIGEEGKCGGEEGICADGEK